MTLYENLMRLRVAELHAEAGSRREADLLARVRRAERRLCRAQRRLDAARLHLRYAG